MIFLSKHVYWIYDWDRAPDVQQEEMVSSPVADEAVVQMAEGSFWQIVEASRHATDRNL